MNDDSFNHISKVTGISVKMLLYYNDLPKECPLYKDDYVYLAPKKRSAPRKTPKYTVKAGDSMHSIAQEYGIKLKSFSVFTICSILANWEYVDLSLFSTTDFL